MYQVFRSLFSCFCLLSISLNAEPCHEKKLLDVVQWLENENPAEVTIQPLSGGVTNLAYSIQGKSLYFAKVWGGTQNLLLGCSLNEEYAMLQALAFTDIAPYPIYCDPQGEVLVTEFIQGTTPLCLRDRETVVKVCGVLKKLHGLDIKFNKSFCPFRDLINLSANAEYVGASLPESLLKALPIIHEWRSSTFHFSKKVPCHLDLHSKNMIQNDDGVYLIDWEYGGQSDPWYDLAVIASAERFTDAEMEELLEIYANDPNPSSCLKEHFWKMRILADARWGIWSYIQSQISVIPLDFKTLGDSYIEECVRRVSILQQIEIVAAPSDMPVGPQQIIGLGIEPFSTFLR